MPALPTLGCLEIYYNDRLATEILKSGSGRHVTSGSHPEHSAQVALYAPAVEHSA
jgi:hypothetical protein